MLMPLFDMIHSIQSALQHKARHALQFVLILSQIALLCRDTPDTQANLQRIAFLLFFDWTEENTPKCHIRYAEIPKSRR